MIGPDGKISNIEIEPFGLNSHSYILHVESKFEKIIKEFPGILQCEKHKTYNNMFYIYIDRRYDESYVLYGLKSVIDFQCKFTGEEPQRYMWSMITNKEDLERNYTREAIHPLFAQDKNRTKVGEVRVSPYTHDTIRTTVVIDPGKLYLLGVSKDYGESKNE